MKNNYFYQSVHDKSNDIYSAHIVSGHATRPHFHRCIEMLYFKEDKVQCTINDEEYILGKNNILFVPPYCVHSLYSKKKVEAYVIVPGMDFIDEFLPQLSKFTLPVKLDDEQFNLSILPYFEKLSNDSVKTSALLKKGYITVILASLIEKYPLIPIKTTTGLSNIMDVLVYIDEHYMEDITLDSIASHFGYNKNYFSRLFNSLIGDNLNSYVNMVRIRQFVAHAKSNKTSDLTELAFSHGFNSMTSFYRYYNKYYDASPSELIKKKK